MSRGRLIVLEGGDGSGKTTLTASVAKALSKEGISAKTVRQPGGYGSEEIRSFLLSESSLSPQEQIALFIIDRYITMRKVILPSLGKGYWFVCDRFTLSTLAYQATNLFYTYEKNLGPEKTQEHWNKLLEVSLGFTWKAIKRAAGPHIAELLESGDWEDLDDLTSNMLLLGDLTFLLHVDREEAKRRMEARGQEVTHFDLNYGMVNSVYPMAYEFLAKEGEYGSLPSNTPRCIGMDVSDSSVEDITEVMLQYLRPYIR